MKKPNFYGGEGGPAQVRLLEAIKDRMDEHGEDFRAAELNLVRTDQGQGLWEAARKESMEPWQGF